MIPRPRAQRWLAAVLVPGLALTLAGVPMFANASQSSLALVGQAAAPQSPRLNVVTKAKANAAVWPASARRAATQFIANSQLPSGAIASHTDKQFLDPYLANFAAWGLAAQCDRGSRRIALGHLQWYAAASKQGPVNDHTLLAGVEQSTGDADSHDAYDATFLSAFAAAWRNGSKSDQKALNKLRPGVNQATKRILGLQDSDGLTWAKTNWKVKYLMDQVEVFWGLSHLAKSGFVSKRKSQPIKRAAARVKGGIQGLWHPQLQTYSYAKHENGVVIPADPAVGYPDAASQLWVIASKIPSAARTRAIHDAISPSLPALSNPAGQWTVDGNPEQVGYWPLLAHAYAATNRTTERRNFAGTYEQARQSSNNAWPYNVGVAGLQLLPANPSAQKCLKN